MRIYFKTKKLMKLGESLKEAQSKLGLKMALKLHQRLMELRAADSLQTISKLPPARCHILNEGRRSGQISVDLVRQMRLLFIPANNPVPFDQHGSLDWSRVTEIEIVEICDTHGGKEKR